MRKSWGELSPAYRARLESRGVTARTHATADLRSARGYHHREYVPTGSIKPSLGARIAKGEATAKELRDVAKSFTWPSWVPRTISYEKGGSRVRTHADVGAVLSQLPPPSRWRGVTLTPRGDYQPWTVVVERKRGAPVEILIPGGGGDGTGAKQVLAILTKVQDDQLLESQEARRRREVEAIFLEVVESP